MSYKNLKKKLFDIKIKVEQTSVLKLKSKNLDKNMITKDLVQYFIFFEELEIKLKKDKSLKLEDYRKQLSLINKYIKTLEQHL